MRLRKLAFCLAMLLIADEANGCPYCDSETSTAIRNEIFGEHFILHTLAMLLPVWCLALLSPPSISTYYQSFFEAFDGETRHESSCIKVHCVWGRARSGLRRIYRWNRRAPVTSSA